jgi:phosphopantothenoylcysteine decarboxylase/phosphopantothenate--cysteine ligase
MPEPTPGAAALAGRRVLVGLSGGIACYKVAAAVSQLVQAGASVRAMMTPAAQRFLQPLTLRSLTGREVITSMWAPTDEAEEGSSPHVALARWCEVLLLAPATADLIGKLAHGLCDDVVSLAACALPRDADGKLRTPCVVAPAMNADMWANPAVQRNAGFLREQMGFTIVGPDEGWQACRTRGAGRMIEPEDLIAATARALAPR